jgi:hypothetical protein
MWLVCCGDAVGWAIELMGLFKVCVVMVGETVSVEYDAGEYYGMP